MNENIEQSPTTIGDLWIPSELANDTNVPWGAKSLYSVIRNLIISNKTVDYCYAANNWFADVFGVSARTVTEWIRSLEVAGYVMRRAVMQNGSYQRRIYLQVKFSKMSKAEADFFCPPDREKSPAPLEENFYPPREKLPYPLEENFQHTLIDTNNNNYLPDTVIDNNPRTCARAKGSELSTLTIEELCRQIDEWYYVWVKKTRVLAIRQHFINFNKDGESASIVFDNVCRVLMSAQSPRLRAAVQSVTDNKLIQIAQSVLERRDKLRDIPAYIRKCASAHYTESNRQSG